MAWNPLEYFREHHLPTSYPSPRLYEVLPYEYALLGAYPMRAYLPERATYSIDLVVDPICKRETEKVLHEISWKEDYYSSTHTFYLLQGSNLYLTLLSFNEPWLTEALEASQKNLDPFITEPAFPFEWLILSKMAYGKRQDYMDCARLIARANSKQLERTKETLMKWLPSALPPLRALYTVGKKELLKAPVGKPAYKNQETEYTSWHHMSARQHQYLDADWKHLVDKPFLDELSTPSKWPKRRIEDTIIN